MEQVKSNPLKTTDKLSRYICIFAYICLYPAFFNIFNSIFGTTYEFLNLYSEIVLVILWGSSYLFIPAVLWLIATKIFKKIHPAITVIYFILFVIMQFLSLIIILFFIGLNNAEVDLT